MVRRLLLAPLIGLAVASGASTAAEASCAGPTSLSDQIQRAALVFVGTVVSTSDEGRIAYVRVESIWKGPQLAENVKVFGSPASGANSATSDDRHYQDGTRYLFVLHSASEPLQDDACSATQPYTPALAALAPADAKAPMFTGYPTDPIPNRYAGPLIIGLIVAATVVSAAVALVVRVARLRSKRG